MATDQTTETVEGGLPVSPMGKGINILGQKGVSLGEEQSAAIRDKLMKMIAEREGYKGSWKEVGDLWAIAASGPGGYSKAYEDYATRGRNREKDLLELYAGVGQIDTERARLKQQAAQDAQFYQNLMGQQPQAGAAPAPQGGALPGAAPAQAPQGGGALPGPQAAGPAPQGGALPGPAPQPQPRPTARPGQQMSDAEKVALYQLYRRDPKKALELQMGRLKPTDLQRELEASGLPPEVINQLIVGVRAGDLFKETPVTQTEGPAAGYKMPSTQFDVVNKRLGLAGANAPQQGPMSAPQATPQEGPMPGPQATPQASIPSGVSATPPAFAQTSTKPVTKAAAPQGGPGSAITVPNPHPVGSEDWRKFNESRAGAEINVQEAAAKDTAKTDAEELASMSNVVSKAPDRMAQLDQGIQHLDKYPQMFGRLMRPTPTSTVMNALSQGLTVGRLGSVGFPGVNELSIQMDPTARKDPGAIRAWNETVSTVNQVLADYTAIANKGQGSVSDQERQLYRNAVGDPAKMDAQSLKQRMLATRLSYQHTLEVDNAWRDAQSRNIRSFQQFKASPQFEQMQTRHYYETAKTLGVKAPEWKREVSTGGEGGTSAAGGEDEAARLRAELRRRNQ